MSDIKAIVGANIDPTIKQINEDLKNKVEPKLNKIKVIVDLDVKNIQKALDNFLKQKPILNIDANIAGFDNFQNDLKKFQDAVNKIVEERKKLEESVGSGNLTTQQVEALKLIEQREKELAAQREQMLKEFAALQEQITKVRLESLEHINAKEQENAAKTEESINRQVAAFQRMYGSLKEGVTLPITGGTDEITKAIRAMEGFSDANVKATGSIQVGEITLDRYIATLKNAGGGFDTYKISVDNATGAVYQLDQGLKSTDTSLIHTSEVANGVINSLAGALVASGIGKGLNEIKDLLWDCVEASIEFETALANVRKTTGFPVSEMQALKDEILSLSTEIPVAAIELSKIAEIGGQLNIPKENIIDFTKVMADLAATTSMTSAEAADFVARFSNITQMKMEDWDKFASSLVQLGNNFAGTESEISAMALRLASAGKQANMTEADILGLIAGLVAVGIKAEMGGTAFSKTMNKINIAVNTGNEDLVNFARIAGMTSQEFVQAFEKDASRALLSFIQGLGNFEQHGKNTIVLLDEIGLTEVRISDALRRAAGSGELFQSAIEMSNQAFEENIALQNEAQIRYATTESQMRLLSNATFELQSVIGDALNPAINNATGSLTDLTLGAAEFLKQNQWLVQSLTVLGVLIGTLAGGITLYAVGIKALTAAKAALGITTKGTTATIKAFSSALVATPLGPIIIALAAVAAAVTAVTIAVGENTRAQEEQARQAEETRQRLIETGNAAKDQANKLMELYSSYVVLSNISNKTADQESQYKTTQEEIIKLLGSRADALSGLTEGTEEYTAKLKELTDEEIRKQLTDVISAKNAAKEALEKADTGSLKITSQAPSGGKWIFEDISDIETLIGKYVELKDVYVLWRKMDEEERLTAPSGSDERLQYYSDLIKAREAMVAAAGEDKKAQEELAATNVYKFLSDEINKLTPSINELIEFETTHALLLYELSNGIPKTTEEYDNMVDSIITAIGVN